VLTFHVLVDYDGVANELAFRTRTVTVATMPPINLCSSRLRGDLCPLMKLSKRNDQISYFPLSLGKFDVHCACIPASKVDANLFQPKCGESVFSQARYRVYIEKVQKLLRCLFDLFQLFVTLAGRDAFLVIPGECLNQFFNQLFLPSGGQRPELG
jgi:hypothetical protein